MAQASKPNKEPCSSQPNRLENAVTKKENMNHHHQRVALYFTKEGAKSKFSQNVWQDIRLFSVPLKTWNRSKIEPTLNVTRAEDFEIACSFNYLTDDASRGSGLSPGVAPMYTPWTGTGLLDAIDEQYKETTGSVAMQLCLQATSREWEKEKRHSFLDYDIICTDRALCRLFRFCTGNISQIRPAYRIDIERVGKTLIMDRSCHEPDVYIPKRVSAFCDKVTKQIGPPPHGRFIEMQSYKLGTLKLLVRTDINAVQYNESDELSQCVSGLATLEIADTTTHRQSQVQVSALHALCSRLTAERKYKRVEITTQSVNKPDDRAGGKWPDLFFSNAVKLIQGRHLRGDVQEIAEFSIDNITENFTEINGVAPSVALSKMVTLLEEVREKIVQRPEERDSYVLLCLFEQQKERYGQVPLGLTLYERVETDTTERYLPSDRAQINDSYEDFVYEEKEEK